MKLIPLIASLLLSLTLVYSSPSRPKAKELDLSAMPTVRSEHSAPRSVNLSFFVPAFSLFALASQFMPQMFPALTQTTSSRHTRSVPNANSNSNVNKPHWLDEFISNGLIY